MRESPSENDPRQISTTHWSLVLAASERQSPESSAALETLCRAFWPAIFAFVRRRVQDDHAARDLTQEFFARLLEKNYLAQAREEKGRFRSFLLAALKHFLANEWDKSRAQKRGGDQHILSLDQVSAEVRWALEPVTQLTPQRAYDRRWALAVIDDVLARLREECAGMGNSADFEHLHEFLAGRAAPGAYERAAMALGVSVGAAQVRAHRLRTRYRELFRAEIAKTVADPAQVDDEIRELLAALES